MMACQAKPLSELMLEYWEQNFDEILIKIYIYVFFFIRENAFENDRKLAAILSWPQFVKQIQNDEIVSVTVQTLSNWCVPLHSRLYCQWHNLIYLQFLFIFVLFPHTLTCVLTKEDIIV